MHSLHRAQLALQCLSALPSPPETTVRLLELTLAPEPSMKDVVALVRTDPGLALEVLRLRPRGERNERFALHLPEAMEAVGLPALRELALRREIRGAITIVDVPEGAYCSLNSRHHSVACAAAACELARASGYASPEIAHAGGLLASVGALALAELFGQEVVELRKRSVGHDVAELLRLESLALGLDHESLGVVLCDAWNLGYELHDALAGLYRAPERHPHDGARVCDPQLVGIVRAAWHVAHAAGFPLCPGLRAVELPPDVDALLARHDIEVLIERVRQTVGEAALIARPRSHTLEEVFATMRRANSDLTERLVVAERRLAAESAVNAVLQDGLRRLGDGDALLGVMFCAMESIGFKRICCLEADLATRKLEVRLSAASGGLRRLTEHIWIPFPAERPHLAAPCIVSREDRVPEHQLVLELIGMSSAVVAPLQALHEGKRLFLCADRGPAGPAPLAGEERYLGIIADQASLLLKFEQLTREKERMATQDPLTGAATRRRLMDRLEFLGGQVERTRLPFSLLMMDLDHFKRFNDTLGHQAGDRLLQDLVKLLTADVRKGDLVARYGGEEFVIVLPNCALEHAVVVAEELRAKVFEYGQASRELYGGLSVSVSIGAAQHRPAESALALIGRADAALYTAKHEGRNRVVHAAA